MSGTRSSCAAELRATAVFCPQCGTPASGPVPRGSVTKEDTAQQAAVPGPPPSGTSWAPSPEPAAPSNRTGTVLHQPPAPVPTAEMAGWLLVVQGAEIGRDFRLDRPSAVLGRNPTCDLVLDDATVSREHLRLDLTGRTVRLQDLGSGNGTYRNGLRVIEAELADGDVLKVGESLLLFKDVTPGIALADADVPVTDLPTGAS